MSRVVFMCGPGSGKSRFAGLLAARGFTVLSVEAWRGFRRMPIPDAAAESIRDVLRERLLEIVDAGGDVVLDFAFWSRRMRDEWRAGASDSRTGLRAGRPRDRVRSRDSAKAGARQLRALA